MPSLITVLGATGQQGGSVARSLVQNPAFKVRGTTRDVDSFIGNELKALGVEVVKASVFNPEDLTAAFQDAWAVFMNLNSNDPAFINAKGPSEIEIAKAIINVAARQGVKYLVMSGGAPWKEMTGGKAFMVASQMKYEAEVYAKQLGKFDSVVAIHPGMYMDNHKDEDLSQLFGGFPLIPNQEGHLNLRIPRWGGDGKVPFIDITKDYGDIVHGILLDPKAYNGKVVQGISDVVSWEDFVAEFTNVTGKNAHFMPIEPSWEAWDAKGIPEVEEIKSLFGAVQLTNGHYFGHDATQIDTAAKLKRATARALNKSENEGRLNSLGSWIRNNLA